MLRTNVKFSGLIKSRRNLPALFSKARAFAFLYLLIFPLLSMLFRKVATMMTIHGPGWPSQRFYLSPKEPRQARWRQGMAGSRGPHSSLSLTQLERASLWCMILTLEKFWVLKEGLSTCWYWSRHSQLAMTPYWLHGWKMNHPSLLFPNNSKKVVYNLFAKTSSFIHPIIFSENHVKCTQLLFLTDEETQSQVKWFSQCSSASLWKSLGKLLWINQNPKGSWKSPLPMTLRPTIIYIWVNFVLLKTQNITTGRGLHQHIVQPLNLTDAAKQCPE